VGSPKSLALKARFTSGRVLSIIGDVPQSLSKVILHIIFSSKNREPWLDSNVRPRMHAYLSTICRHMAWISTNATFGIRTLDESHLQRLCNPGNQIPGAMPQAEYDLAPWR